MLAKVEDLDRLTDAELLRRHSDGEDGAIDLLLSRHAEALHRFCLRRVRNPADADDLCQESLMRAVTQIDRLKAGAAFRTWLFRIAHNLSIDWGRRDCRLQTLPLPEEDTAALPAALETPLELVQADEERVMAASALSDLKDSYREALLLHQIEGRRVADVAEQLKLTHGATEVLLFRARRRLREAYHRRERGVSGVAILAALRQLAAHLAAPLAGGAAVPAAGMVAAVTIGAAVIGVSHTGHAHQATAHRPTASITHPISRSHVAPAQVPQVALQMRAVHTGSTTGFSGRKPFHGRWSARVLGGRTPRTLRAPSIAPPASYIAGQRKPLHREQVVPSPPSHVPVSLPRSQSVAATVSRTAPRDSTSAAVTVPVAPAGTRRSSSARLVPSHGSGKAGSNHQGEANGRPQQSHSRVDQSPQAHGGHHSGSRSHNEARAVKQQHSPAMPATAFTPSSQSHHSPPGHMARTGHSGPRAQPATSGSTPPAPSQSPPAGHKHKGASLPGAASASTVAPSVPGTASSVPGAPASSPPAGTPPGQAKKAVSQGQPLAPVAPAAPTTPAAPAAPAPSVSATTVPVASGSPSGCPPTAHGAGCSHKP